MTLNYTSRDLMVILNSLKAYAHGTGQHPDKDHPAFIAWKSDITNVTEKIEEDFHRKIQSEIKGNR